MASCKCGTINCDGEKCNSHMFKNEVYAKRIARLNDEIKSLNEQLKAIFEECDDGTV